MTWAKTTIDDSDLVNKSDLFCMRFLHVPLMYWRCERICNFFAIRPDLLRVKITHKMTEFEYNRNLFWSITMRLSRYPPKRVHHFEELDVQKTRIQIVNVSQTVFDKTLSFACPKPSSPYCQLIYQIVLINEYFVTAFGRP